MVVDPANVCDNCGVSNYSIYHHDRIVVIPNHACLEKLANHLGCAALSPFATNISAFGWIYEIRAAYFNEAVTNIE